MFDPDSSLPPAKMQDGAFLIDSSPSCFQVILHWLRYREVALGEVSGLTALSVAKYFGLQRLVEALEEIVDQKMLELGGYNSHSRSPSVTSHRQSIIGVCD